MPLLMEDICPDLLFGPVGDLKPLLRHASGRSRLIFAGHPQESTGHPRDIEPVSDNPFVDGVEHTPVAQANASTFTNSIEFCTDRPASSPHRRAIPRPHPSPSCSRLHHQRSQLQERSRIRPLKPHRRLERVRHRLHPRVGAIHLARTAIKSLLSQVNAASARTTFRHYFRLF